MSLNIDSVVNSVKNIVDNHRCMICDKLDGSRWRYSCWHVGCGDCVEVSNSCILCLTPFGVESKKPVHDLALTKRVEHTQRLLATCQDALGIDVYKRHRQTEQQKVEKEVFPECIQAVSKYSNKRKSLISGIKKDDSSVFLPGEKTSPVRPTRIEKSFNYLQQWLDNIVDEFPKQPSRKQLNSESNHGSRKSNVKTRTTFKRRANLIMDKFHESESTLKRNRKNEKDESGIVMDDPIIDDSDGEKIQHDTFDVINVSQSTQHDAPVVDKDRLAWLAVLEAEKIKTNETPSIRLECSEIIQYTNDILYDKVMQLESGNTHLSKVPFFKKSSLADSCKNCILDTNTDNNVAETSTPKKVEINIESKAFTVTINTTHVTPNTISHKKQSVSVQTDITDIETSKSNIVQLSHIKFDAQMLRNPTTIIAEKDSLDLFTGEINISNDHENNEAGFNLGADYHKYEPKSEKKDNPIVAYKANTLKQLKPIPVIFNQPRTEAEQNRPPSKRSRTTIQDSDTSDDDGLNKSETLTVIAEVHRSSNQYDYAVFSDLIESNVVLRPTTYKKRVRTPNSSDSSDKENRDPNRGKRIKMEKKDPFKKKNRKKLGIVN